jgi:hypothetical protein
MNHRFAWTLAAFIPLAAGCLDDVALADKTDGGTRDAPVVDAPSVDAPAVDAPSVDAPVTDAPGIIYCPEEVDYNAGQNPDLRYRRAAFAVPPDAGTRLDPGATVEVTGTWAGTRLLATPIVVGCIATDARDACRADTVIRVRSTAGLMNEFVVGLAPGELTALTDGAPVVLRARATQWDGATPIRYEGELTVRRASDNALMLAIATGLAAPADVELATAFEGAVCRSRPEPLCNRVLTAFSLRFGAGSGARVVAPGEEAVVNEGGSLLCRNRASYRRTGSGGVECADVTPSVVSFEIVRQP